MSIALVAYASFADSTVEFAQPVGERFAGQGLKVEVLPIARTADLQEHDAVVIGGPMIMGWHRAARRFLRRQRVALQQID